MALKTVGWLLGIVWVGLGAVLAVPGVVALILGEPWLPFAVAVAVAVAGGSALAWLWRGAERALDHRAAFLMVTLTWLSACVLGAIPLALHPEPQISLIDSLFESTSGFTTTGATVLSGLDEMPRSLLLWRSIEQWLGGMGMVVFGVAILPLLGVGGMQLYKAEAPGPTKDKMTPRIAETAKLLWVLYLGLSVVTLVLYFAAGMSLFDAVCHSMTSIATGGFSTHDASLGFYDSAPIRLIATVAMLTGGTSFAILHRVLTGGLKWRDQPELRAYLGIFALAAVLIASDLTVSNAPDFTGFFDALSHAMFQAASIMTTTGYATRDWDLWPDVSHVTLFLLFFLGGMAGSTSGGVKVIRLVLLFRLAFAQFFRLLHPHAVAVVRLGPLTVEDQILVSSLGFVGLWLLLLALGSILLSMGGLEPLSSVTAAAVTLGNIGPGFNEVGPSRTFAPLSTFDKSVMSALMVLGRLEIYTVLIILTPSFWRR